MPEVITSASISLGGDNLVMNMGGGASATARFLQHGLNVNALRTNDILRRDEWKLFDDVVIKIARQRLNGVKDLLSLGLVFPVKNPLGKTIIQWEDESDMEDAVLSMDGISRDAGDRLDFTQNRVPNFITHKDFYLNIRHLEASRTLGEALDTAQAGVAARRVADKLEDTLFNGSLLSVSGDEAFGYLNHPNRNTGTFEGTGDAWDSAGKTGAQILDDVRSMMSVLQADFMFGPYILYVPSLYWIPLTDDFKAESDKTILQRILDLPSIQDVKPADVLPANNTVMVQMTQDVVDMAVGQETTTVFWESEGGMQLNFKVMAIMVPRVKKTQTGQSGIAHFIPE